MQKHPHIVKFDSTLLGSIPRSLLDDDEASANGVSFSTAMGDAFADLLARRPQRSQMRAPKLTERLKCRLQDWRRGFGYSLISKIERICDIERDTF